MASLNGSCLNSWIRLHPLQRSIKRLVSMEGAANIARGNFPASIDAFERFTKSSPRLGSKPRGNEVNQWLFRYAQERQWKWRNRRIVSSMDLHPRSSITRIAIDDRLSRLREKSIEINHRFDPTLDTRKHAPDHKTSVAPANQDYIPQVFHLNMKCHVFYVLGKISRPISQVTALTDSGECGCSDDMPHFAEPRSHITPHPCAEPGAVHKHKGVSPHLSYRTNCLAL